MFTIRRFLLGDVQNDDNRRVLSSLESQCREFRPSFNVKVTFDAFRHRSFFTSCSSVVFWSFIGLGSRIILFFC